MTHSPYLANDCVLLLPSGFVDLSVNVLQWPLASGRKLVLVIQRENAPKLSLQALFERETASLPQQFEGFRAEPDPGTGDLETDSIRRFAFRWIKDGEVFFESLGFVCLQESLFVLTATGHASDRDDVEAILDAAIADLRLREV